MFNLGIPISEIYMYLICCHTGKNIIWKFFIENDFIYKCSSDTITIILLSVVFCIVEKLENKLY